MNRFEEAVRSVQRRKRRRRLLRYAWMGLLGMGAVALVLAIPFLSSSCAGRSPALAPPETPPARDTHTLRLRLPSDPHSLDPARANDSASIAVISQIFDGLVELDPATGMARPALAESWTVSPDGLSYTFHLRASSRFNYGREVAASDVVFSFERLLSPKIASERRWVLAHIRGAQAFSDGKAPRVSGLDEIDRRTLRIDLESPSGSFLSMLALEAASIVPRDVYGDPEERYLRAPVGSGPFRFDRWEAGVEIALSASREHWAGAPALDTIVFRILPSEPEALEEYLAGRLDVLDAIPGARRADLIATHASELRHGVQPAVAFVAFNNAKAPFKDNHLLRQALNHAVDRDALCRLGQEGKDRPASGILPPGIAGGDTGATAYPYDPARARKLLDLAGYPGGRGLPALTLGFGAGAANRRVCEKIAGDLAAVGVTIELKELDAAALMRAAQGQGGDEAGPDLDMVRTAWLADYPDPDAFLTPTLSSTSTPATGNIARYANPRFDALLEKARAATDPAQRLRLFQEAERFAVEDAPWLFLYTYGEDTLVKPYVKGFVIPAFGELLAPLQRVSIEPGPSTAGM